MRKETGHMSSKSGNWLISKWSDLLLLFLPIWVLWLYFFSNADLFNAYSGMPVYVWVIFILGIDVAHVWSSLFRTYLSKEEFSAQKRVLVLSPIIALIISVILINISIIWFWRIMAYLAVFHFIKQQYGFIALYKLKAAEKTKQWLSDKWMVYIATLYPIVFWHFNSDASINWFVENDFFALYSVVGSAEIVHVIFTVLNIVYWGIIGLWLFLQIRAKQKGEVISVGKVLWMLTTAVNWWFGIVYFNSDIVFSVSNVVAHGIPYIVLIYFYRLRKEEIIGKKRPQLSWRLKWGLVLIFTILIAAIIEEYFWDMLVYRDHSSFFQSIFPYHWDQVSSHWGIVLAIALLALPQQVHYIIDGFIWKMNAKNKYLKPIFKPGDES